MFYQQALKPDELRHIISHVGECFIVIEGQLPNHYYHVALYKYQQEYFLLDDERVFQMTHRLEQEGNGEAQPILTLIEEALAANLYQLVDEELIKLDLKILTKLFPKYPVQIHYYEFI